MDLKKYILYSKVVFCGVFVLCCAVSCNEDKPEKIAAIADRSALPQLHATEITTVISDSGITRYRISTPCWDVYDRAKQPYWEFPKGIHLERFDENLKVDANIHSDYAKYNEYEQIWELRGNVKMTNLKGELYETSQVFWNQREECFYSDSLVKITTPSQIYTGKGFRADQNLNNYQLGRSSAIFSVKKEDM